MKLNQFIVTIVSIFIFSCEVYALPITIFSGETVTQVKTGPNISEDTVNLGTVPLSQEIAASSIFSSSAAQVTLLGGDDLFSYNVDFDHSVSSLSSSTRVYNNSFFFSPNVNSNYSLSGDYSFTSTGGFFGGVFEVELIDLFGGNSLFRDTTTSQFITNELVTENFELGDINDGNFQNVTFGSLTGNLIGGSIYKFSFDSRLTGGTLGIGNGNVLFEITAAPVPIPGSIWLFLFALTSLFLYLQPKFINSTQSYKTW